MKCPKCGEDEWRCQISQSVNVEFDGYGVMEIGCDFSAPDTDEDSVFCNNCGFMPSHQEMGADAEAILFDEMFEAENQESFCN